MKYVWKNFKSFMINDRIIFFITLLSVFVSSVVLLLSYGLYNNYQNEKKEIEVFPETICGEGTEYLTKSSLIDYLLSISSDVIDQTDMFYCTAHVEPYDNDLELRFSVSEDEIVNPDQFVNNYNSSLKNSGRYFSDEEMKSGKRLAISYLEPDKKNYSYDPFVVIDGEEYEVIGTSWFSETPIIPFTSLKDNVKIDYIEIIPKASVTRDIFEEYCNKSSDLLIFEQPEIHDLSDVCLSNNLILISVLISVISGVNYASLYKFIFLKRKKELAVLRLCGCSVLHAMFIYLIECISVATVVYVVSGIIFNIFAHGIISNVFKNIDAVYNFKVYIIIYLFYITITLIMLCVTIYRTVTMQIKTLISEG